jgi:hypothetical protein
VANNIFGDEIFTVLAVKVACCFIPVNTKVLCTCKSAGGR